MALYHGLRLFPTPLAVLENHNFTSIRCNARNIDVVRANHKVNVRARNVDSVLQKFLFGHVIPAFDALGKTDTQRKKREMGGLRLLFLAR